MNAAFAIDPPCTGRSSQFEDEKVGLSHIRLSLARHSLRASVGNFFAADKVLYRWATSTPAPLECEFEIVYDDGHTLAGAYRFQCKRAARPALMAFVRKTLEALCAGTGEETQVRGLTEGPQRFLAHYEIEDFTAV